MEVVVAHVAVWAGTAGLAGLRLVDSQGAAVVFLAVHRVDGGLSLGVVSHLDESKTLGTPGVTVGDDSRRVNLAELGEELVELGVSDGVAQVANIQILAHCLGDFSCLVLVSRTFQWIALSRGHAEERSLVAQSENVLRGENGGEKTHESACNSSPSGRSSID